MFADTGTQAWTTIEAELLTVASRVDGAVRTATIMEGMKLDGVPFDYAFDQTLSAWDEPPIAINETTSLAIKKEDGQNNAAGAHFTGHDAAICHRRAVDRGADHCH